MNADTMQRPRPKPLLSLKPKQMPTWGGATALPALLYSQDNKMDNGDINKLKLPKTMKS